MPSDMISSDPLISNAFFLDIKGDVLTSLMTVSGLNVEVDVVEVKQVTKDGRPLLHKTFGSSALKAPDLTLTRLAPVDKASDPLWTWFESVRKGMKYGGRDVERKDGSIIMFNTVGGEVARFNFLNGWPSKINTSDLGIDKNDPVTETITLTIESLDRVK